MYSVIELATAVKPTFLSYLLEQGAETVLYLDPDIEVFTSLDDLFEAASEHGIALTPHLTEPHPRWDALVPTEDIVLGAGIYNLGFIGVGSQAGAFLDWWSRSLARECIVDVPRGRFVDQRWVDLVPGYFGAAVIRDAGFNVAWWNLPTRQIHREGDAFTVNGAPLRFMHFSGYDPDIPHLLSKHQGGDLRVLLTEHPALAELCKRYATKLREQGFDLVKGLRYGYAHTPGGAQIDWMMRCAYRAALMASKDSTDPQAEPPSPFVAGEEAAFGDWLRQPKKVGPGTLSVGRYLEQVWNLRSDLQVAFPNLMWGDGERLIEWARVNGHDELPNTYWALFNEGASATFSPPEELLGAPLGDGVNVAGYFRSELGVGEAARLVLAGVRAAAVEHSTVLYDRTPSRQGQTFDDDGLAHAVHRTNVICVNADQYLSFMHEAGPAFRNGHENIAVWWWEVSEFPDTLSGPLALVDELWVGSRFVADAIKAKTDKPVHVMPLPMQPERTVAPSVVSCRLPAGYRFLFSFDLFSVMERKNPLGLVEAYTKAFTINDGASLVIKTINGDKRAIDLERLRWAVRDRPDIQVWDGYLAEADNIALMASADCYVSLHRSEGFGLTMAEAMSLGRPVIATGYSGNLEFMNSGNSYLVPFSLVGVPENCAPYPSTAVWADPDIGAAAELLRWVFMNQDEASRMGEKAREEILSTRTPERMGSFILERLADRAHLARAIEPEPAPRRGVFRRSARRVLWRALRPYTTITDVVHANHDHRLACLEARLDLATSAQSQQANLVRALIDANAAASEIKAASIQLRVNPDVISAAGKDLALRHNSLVDRVDAMTTQLQVLTAALTPYPYMTDPSLLRVETANGAVALGFNHSSHISTDDRYIHFEEIFRGSENFIRERQRSYLDVIGRREPVLDLGCGRGELLDLVRGAGLVARGVDLDPGMVARCIAKGHDVRLADAVAELSGLPDDSLGVIFTAQVIEHLDDETLTNLMTLAQAKLKPGGILIAETVNLHSLSAFKMFWLDPTHRTQIFPEVALALARGAGFSAGRIIFPNGIGDLETDRLRCGEYALVATKSSPTSEESTIG